MTKLLQQHTDKDLGIELCEIQPPERHLLTRYTVVVRLSGGVLFAKADFSKQVMEDVYTGAVEEGYDYWRNQA